MSSELAPKCGSAEHREVTLNGIFPADREAMNLAAAWCPGLVESAAKE